MLGLSPLKKRTKKAEGKGGSMFEERTKSAASSRFGKHKDVQCNVLGCDWIGRSDNLKANHVKKHTEEEIKQYF